MTALWARLRDPGAVIPTRWRDQMPTLVLAIAVIAVAARIATLAVALLPSHRAVAPAQMPPVATPGGGNEVQIVRAANLFGNPNAPASGADAPQTQVPLVLSGTLAVADPKAGLAIIGESAASGRVYATGSGVPGGVTLVEVYADRVVLSRQGALETLRLPRGSLAAGVAAPVAGAHPAAVPAVANNREARRMLDRMPSVIGEVVRPMPNYANGQLKGFKLYAGKDREKFQELGLQPGDLVTHVNGVPLGDAQHGMEVLRTLTGGGPTTVTLERDGAPQQVTIDPSQIAALTGGAQPPTAPAPSNPP